jgi:Xaa-Pro dipeptidase
MTSPEFGELAPMTAEVKPISPLERDDRLEKARRLMAESGLSAIYLEAGASLRYFGGVEWSLSERLLGAVIPARGRIAYVCPAFEEARLREQLPADAVVRAWDEHEDPRRRLAQLLGERCPAGATVGVEEAVRFFVFDGVRREAPTLQFASADAVTIGCRAFKSAAEVALLQRANDITVAAYRATLRHLRDGMTQREFREISVAAHRALGVEGAISAEFGSSTAYPHGSRVPTVLREGDVVLMDGSCTVDGYWSDISRTIVYGQPTQRFQDVWAVEKEAQAAAYAAAQLGEPMERADAAAREVITRAGFGPDYRVPGLPHRTGHGVGLEIHEWHNVVRGNRVPLTPGLCFSDEPMIAIYGEFGVRLEDCIFMAEDGPHFFSQPSPSVEVPFS